MSDSTTGVTPDDSGGGWPAAIVAACGVIASPKAIRRLASIIILMIVLVLVAKLPMSALPELPMLPSLPPVM
jgi:hypothetical protein